MRQMDVKLITGIEQVPKAERVEIGLRDGLRSF
jgi:hypothetical protein